MKVAATRKARRIAKEAVEAEKLETLPWEKIKVQVAFYFKDKRRRDQRNFESMLKATYDGLVDAGLVVDDDYEHMKHEESTFAVDKINPRIEILIERKD